MIVTTDMSCPISEDTVLWIGKTPTTDDYNYVVSRVAKSINSISIAVREVDVLVGNTSNNNQSS